MFGKQKAQPKDEHEQPEIMIEESSDEERNPPYHDVPEGGKPLYVNGRVRCYEPDPSIIDKVWK